MSVGVHTDCHEPRVRDHFLCRITIVVMHRCASWTIEKTEHQRIDAFRLWCLRRLLRVSWTARRSSQTILKKINPNIHWKGWCWSWSSNNLATWCKEPTHWKRPWCWETLSAGKEGQQRMRWIGWHYQINGHEFEQTLGDSEGERSLACCSPWGRKELDTIEQLNNNNAYQTHTVPLKLT